MNIAKRIIKGLHVRFVHPELIANMREVLESDHIEWIDENELTEDERLVEAMYQRRWHDAPH